MAFHWSDNTQDAFDTLKEELYDSPVLKYPDYYKPFVLTTDASCKFDQSWGDAIARKQVNGSRQFSLRL